MKIIITEAQYDKLTEENLREFLYSFWDKQKRSGEEPVLDDMLYNVLGVRKNTSEDYQQIRPIWYEYNGGMDVLYDKMIGDIYGKTFRCSLRPLTSEGLQQTHASRACCDRRTHSFI